MSKFFWISLLALCMALPSYAQQVELTEADLEEFRERAAAKVGDFMDYLPVVAEKGKQKADDKKRQVYYKDQTLELFVEKGRGQGEKAAIMEISFIKPNNEVKIESMTMPIYLDRLINNGYAKVKLQFAETFYISNFYPTGQNQYKATATIFQKFTGYGGDGQALYVDVTKKTIEIVVELVEDLYGKRWVVLLKDVSVAETFKP